MFKPNVLIGTPAYGGNVHTDYVDSLMGIYSAKESGFLDFSVATISNESLITRARNTIISIFYHNPEFSHLFFVDSDLGFPPKTLPLLLQQEKDVIGVPVPLKGKKEDGSPIFNIGNLLSDPDNDNGAVEVEHVGSALMMLSRNAAKSLCDNSDTYVPSNLTRGYKQTDKQFDVFQVGVKNGVYLSEDYFVCHRLRQLGFKIHIYPNISVRHNGNYVFTS